MTREPLKRKTISLDPDLWSDAESRMRALRIRKFSPYVASLIEADLTKRGPLTVVKVETTPAPKRKRK